MSAGPATVRRPCGSDDADPAAWFNALVELSRIMLDQARAGHWDRVAELEAGRQRQFEAFFSEPVPAALTTSIGAGIRAILDLDRQLISLAKAGMEDLSADLDRLRAGRRARSAYAAAAP